MLTKKFLDLTASFGADWVNWVLVGISLAVLLGIALIRRRGAAGGPPRT
jgi:hypothetical protein